MLELTRRSITENSAELCLKVPAKDANAIAEAFMQFLKLAKYDVREINDEGEELIDFNDAFPEPSPAQLLRGARTREGLTQAELADALGIHKNNVSEMERGVRNISVDMAKRLADVLNTSYKHFL